MMHFQEMIRYELLPTGLEVTVASRVLVGNIALESTKRQDLLVSF